MIGRNRGCPDNKHSGDRSDGSPEHHITVPNLCFSKYSIDLPTYTYLMTPSLCSVKAHIEPRHCIVVTNSTPQWENAAGPF